MANVTIFQSQGFASPVNLLGQFTESDIVTSTADTFKLVFPDGYDDPASLAGYSVTYTGTFTYGPPAGAITSVEVRDSSDALVLKIDSFPLGEQVDLSTIYDFIVGDGADYSKVMEALLAGNDTITGGDGIDLINMPFNGGNDSIVGGGELDALSGGIGDDTLVGDGGFDFLDYSQTGDATHGAIINVKAGTAIDPWGDTDTFSDIQGFGGSNFADTFNLKGVDTETRFYIQPWEGADVITLSQINNVVVSYLGDTDVGIVVKLGAIKSGANGKDAKGTIKDFFGDTDTVTNLQRVEGTMVRDKFVGSAHSDYFDGLDGKDTFDGGDGRDFVQFGNITDHGGDQAVIVDLSRSSGQIRNDGFGNVEDAKNFEGLFGSRFNDKFTGGDAAETFIGAGGKDTLKGGKGADKFAYGMGNQGISEWGDKIKDFKSGTDKFVFSRAGIDGLDAKVRFHNGSSATQAEGNSEFYFKASNHTLYLDLDGVGADAAIAVAVLTGVTSLASHDIKIYANYALDIL